MTTNLSLSGVAAVLEELYLRDNTLADQVMRNNPFLGVVPKSTKAGGKYRHVQIKTVRPQGRSALFGTAQTNAIGTKRFGFNVTWNSNYQIAGIDGDVIDDAKGNETILIDHIKAETDGAIDNMRDDIAMSLFRNGGGARGQISAGSSVGTATITLATVTDVVNFEVGMVLQAATTDGTSGSLETGSVTIKAIDRDAGTITATGNWSAGIGTIAASDYLFAAGDFGAKTAGLDGWVPATAPTTGDSWFGVDRSSDPVRLAGVRYVGTNQPLEQALINGAAQVERLKRGPSVDIAFINPLKFSALEISLEGRKRVEDVMGEGPAAHIGYRALLLDTPNNQLKVMSDPSCQFNTAWLLKKDAWVYETSGDIVRLLEEDGLPFLRQTSADGYELRIKNRGNMYCNEPGANCRVTW